MQSITAQNREKADLRIHVRAQLAAISPQEMHSGDRRLFARFLALPQVEKAETVFLYWGMKGLEVDTQLLVPQLISRGKRVCVPRTVKNRQMAVHFYRPGDRLEKTAYGIMEPAPDSPTAEKREIDLALVPALCYDRRGYRLGYGGGYYDRWLADFPGITVGLCRAQVLRAEVPVEPHDVPVHFLLTEGEVMMTGQRQ